MTDQFRYCAVVWMNHNKNLEFDDDLEDLISYVTYDEDDGRCYCENYYQLIDGVYIKIDTEDIKDRIREERDKTYDESRAKRKEKCWNLILVGPEGGRAFWQAYETEKDAERAALEIPTGLTTIVEKSRYV